MNKHIELVKKWLADSESVTQQELEDNRAAANAAADAAARTARAAYNAAADAATSAAARAAADAKYWVNRYEELKEQGE